MRCFSRILGILVVFIMGCVGDTSDAMKEGGLTADISPSLGFVTNGITSLGQLLTVQELRTQKEKEGELFIKDDLAIKNFSILEEMSSSNKLQELSLPIFQLMSPQGLTEDMLSRKNILGIPDSVELTNRDVFIEARHESKQLRINTINGTEFYKDRNLFHKGAGQTIVLAKNKYLELAQKHLKQMFPENEKDGVLLTPYKIRYYKNAVRDETGETNETIYQVAVSFNSTFEGLPVIGAGSKVAIHMTPAGDLVSYESTVRNLEKTGHVLGSKLLSPQKAKIQIEKRLTDRGIDVSHLILARAEFGYLRLGRNSVQKHAVPHYAFFYRPKDGVIDKQRVEVIPAVTDSKILELIEADLDDERHRKHRITKHTTNNDR